VNDEELAAVIAAALALLRTRDVPLPPPPPARWRLAARIGDVAARSTVARVPSRWAAAGRAS